jgi:hypothetical protein
MFVKTSSSSDDITTLREHVREGLGWIHMRGEGTSKARTRGIKERACKGTYQADDGLLDVLEAGADDAGEGVEAHDLLREHGVHRLAVRHGELFHDVLVVKLARQLLQQVCCEVVDRLVARATAARRLSWERQQDAVEELVGLLLVLAGEGLAAKDGTLLMSAFA